MDGAVTHGNAVGRAPSPDCGLGAGLKYPPQVFRPVGFGLEPGACLVNEDAVSGVRDAGSRCLGLTTSLSADQIRSAGTDWTAPDLASAPDEVL
ncbi:MAG: hypothetical protein ACXVBO_01175, partial [Isosphaeraceae bacterium]